MYLQVTTKCNMRCAHCCYSCGKNGKHMTRDVWQEAIQFASSSDDSSISIGGGEPTLHPDFFEILQRCVWAFDSVWMATNGSRTKTMWRLARIIEDGDCKEEYDPIILNHEYQLIVAISDDYFHGPINEKVMQYWKMRAKQIGSGFEIRNVTNHPDGPIAQGRAKRTGSGWSKNCCCSDLMLLHNGNIKLCGCSNSPIIGNVRSGIEEKWQAYIDTEDYRWANCYNTTKEGKRL